MQSNYLATVIFLASICASSLSLASGTCGDEDLNKWVGCEKENDCVIEVVPCGQVRSINKKFLKASRASQDCLSVRAGPCLPGLVEPKKGKFRAICKANRCSVEANK